MELCPPVEVKKLLFPAATRGRAMPWSKRTTPPTEYYVSESNDDYYAFWCNKVLLKVKVIPLLFFNWAPPHEGISEGWRYSSTHSLNSALDRGKWSASRPARFTLRGRAPAIHWIWGWVGPKAVRDTAVKRKISSPHLESNPRTPIVQPVA
jgi:hypothetical protein